MRRGWIGWRREAGRAGILLLVVSGATTFWIGSSSAQPGLQERDKAGKGKDKDKQRDEIARFPDRLERIRRAAAYLHSMPSSDQQALIANSEVYANRAEQVWRSQQPYIADRVLTAAESLTRASRHLEHLAEAPGPVPPQAEEVSRRLALVYFRTRQASYFLQEIRDSSASPLGTLALKYYQRAVQSYDRSDIRAADEYGKVAEELVRALENLAQAATLPPQPLR
jgi:hypothetical protein